ncbi:MAG TPA: cytochrome c [Oscillatoriaceae cyanobacterium]
MSRFLALLLALTAIAGCNDTNAGTYDPYGGYSNGAGTYPGYSQPTGGYGQPTGGYSQPTTGSVSYSAVVAPLLSQACAGCHTPGGLGGNNIQLFDQSGQLDYQSVSGGIGQIIGQVSSGRMPQGRQPLSQQEVAELEAWAQEGAPQN